MKSRAWIRLGWTSVSAFTLVWGCGYVRGVRSTEEITVEKPLSTAAARISKGAEPKKSSQGRHS